MRSALLALLVEKELLLSSLPRHVFTFFIYLLLLLKAHHFQPHHVLLLIFKTCRTISLGLPQRLAVEHCLLLNLLLLANELRFVILSRKLFSLPVKLIDLSPYLSTHNPFYLFFELSPFFQLCCLLCLVLIDFLLSFLTVSCLFLSTFTLLSRLLLLILPV